MLLVRVILDLYFNHEITLNELRDNIDMSYRVIDANSDFHYISIEHPKDIGVEYELESYNQWYVDFISRNYDSLTKIGLERVNLFLNVFFSGQCNFEIFDKNSLSELSKYGISLPISIFNLPNEELKDILKENGYSKERITQIFNYE